MIYDSFDELGKSSIKATRTDLTSSTGVDNLKEVIRKVLSGENVRDTTEFITQRRLIKSYAAMLDLFVNTLGEKTNSIQEYSDYVARDLGQAKNEKQKTLDLWLMGLTNKGLDNIVRNEANLENYKDSFAVSTSETIADVQNIFGNLTGKLELNGVEISLDWNIVSLLCIALGSQTLSNRLFRKSFKYSFRASFDDHVIKIRYSKCFAPFILC